MNTYLKGRTVEPHVRAGQPGGLIVTPPRGDVEGARVASSLAQRETYSPRESRGIRKEGCKARLGSLATG